MSKLQLKIMGALTVLVVVVVGASGFLAERGLRETTTNNIRVNLEREARLIEQLVAGIPFDASNAQRLQSLVLRAASSTGSRITLIDADGRVIADSDVPEEEIGTLSNHADRPEIIQAAEVGDGYGIRRSETLKHALLYVALRTDADDGSNNRGFVRLAIYLDEVDAAAANLRRELIAAGLMGLLVALAVSYGLSLLSLRPVRELREVVMEISKGRLERRLGWESRDELGEIAGSLNRLARQLRESADQALLEKEQLEAVLSSMVEGVVVIDHDGSIMLVNPRAREMLSVWGDVKGRPVSAVIDSPKVDEALQDAATSDAVVVRELAVRAEKERILLMHASAFPPGGPRAGTVAVFHDVSELRRVDQIRQDFIANASHELRTPLTAIQGFADSLLSADVDGEQHKKYLDVIVRNAQRMSSLIDDLLVLSRIESGAAVLELSEIDVVRVVEHTISDFGPRFQEAGIDVELHANDVPSCRADRRALEQVLGNLLSNAARYSNPGAKVDVFVEPRGDRIEICVADTGIGIPGKDLERIFERFYRVDEARSRVLGSTGLGLAIVKHLVRSMGSEITVESEIGRGSRFRFSLAAA